MPSHRWVTGSHLTHSSFSEHRGRVLRDDLRTRECRGDLWKSVFWAWHVWYAHQLTADVFPCRRHELKEVSQVSTRVGSWKFHSAIAGSCWLLRKGSSFFFGGMWSLICCPNSTVWHYTRSKLVGTKELSINNKIMMMLEKSQVGESQRVFEYGSK